MFVLSYTMPPKDGAKFGKATVSEVVTEKQYAADIAGDKLISMGEPTMTARRFALSLAEKDTGTNWVHTGTGIVFRIDPADRAPNVCPCCGRLVLFGDHAFAGTEDAYCLGCYTWGDDSKISCDPNHTTHPNPWTVSPMNARWSMEITIDWGDQTGHDIRYSAHRTAHELWDDEDNALIAWPGLSRDQILSVEIKEI